MDKKGSDAGLLFSQAIESDRQLLILTDQYLGAYPGPATLIVYDLNSGKLSVPERSSGIIFLARSPEGAILASTLQGMRQVDPDALRQNKVRLLSPPFPYRAADTLPGGCIYFDRSRNLWLSTPDGIVKINPEGKKQLFNTVNGLPAGVNNSIFQDAENNMWFANEQNGITKLVNQEVEFYSQVKPGLSVNTLYADGHSDSSWFYDEAESKLLLDARSGQKVFHGIGPLPSPGEILIGKNAYMIGLHGIYDLHFLLRSQQFRTSLIYEHQPGQDSGKTIGFSSAIFDKDGDLILTSDKLTVLHAGKLFQQPLDYMTDQAAIDKYNRIWVITRSNRLSVFTKGNPDTGPCLQLLHTWSGEWPVVAPRSIAVDTGGRVWIGTRDHGLFCLFFDGLRLLSYKQLTIKNGLSENFVNYIRCDPDNTIWACTPAGLDKIRIGNGRFTIDNITRSNSVYQRIYRILPSANGIHWALAKGGVIKINPPAPAEKKNNYIPHVLFSQILTGNEPVTDVRQELKLPYDRNALSFYIGASTFIDETQTRYTYLLEGSNNTRWSAPSDQSAINFVNLSPGKYVLKVRAQFLTGRYPDQSAAYSFVILPPWWQTWWFRAAALCLLAVLGLVWIRFYVRRKLEKQRSLLEKKQAIEKERTRIATDMHDDLGAGLSRIKFLSETIGIRKQQQLPVEDEITSIRQYSHEMIDKMGEIVWALNEKNDSLSDLLSYTRAYAMEYFVQAGICCEIETPDDLSSRFVSGEFRRNVYLTIKEALHNIVKHSRARKVFIGIEVGEKLTITIRDDGIGFDKQHIRPFSNGLINMERRVRDIGGELLILHGSGTTVWVSVPV